MSINKKVDVSFIFQITDKVLWNVFKKNEIGEVLLPFVVLRRLDCILEPVNHKVRDSYNSFKDKVNEEKLAPILRRHSALAYRVLGLVWLAPHSPFSIQHRRYDVKSCHLHF